MRSGRKELLNAEHSPAVRNSRNRTIPYLCSRGNKCAHEVRRSALQPTLPLFSLGERQIWSTTEFGGKVMKRNFAIVLAVVALALLPFRAFAANLFNGSIPVSFTVSNPCNGDVVTFSGTLHQVINETIDGNGACI
jgi:hypothetical protein